MPPTNGHHTPIKPKHVGRIVAIKGAVVDVHFPLELPEIYNALTVQNANKLTLEVFEHLTNHTVRCLSMLPTTGLELGLAVHDTGGVLHVPVGEQLLGRIVNVFGKPIDKRGPIHTTENRPIHKKAPASPTSKVPPKLSRPALKSSTFSLHS
jgi:F-type H+/Na+-transporting ATPase subunit beta